MINGSWVDAVVNGAGKISPEVDLGRVWETLMLVVPTCNAMELTLEVSEKSGGTFQDLHITDTIAADTNQWTLTDGSGDVTAVAPIGGFQFIKVKVTNAQNADRTVRCLGARS